MLNPNLPSDLLSDHSSNTRCMHSVWRRIHACLLPIYHHWFIATHYSAQENTLAALTHYMRYGTLSGRLAVLSNNGIPDRGKSGISTKMAPKIHIETLMQKISKHWYWKSSYLNLSYGNINIENIESLNHIKPIRLKFHIEPTLLSLVYISTDIANLWCQTFLIFAKDTWPSNFLLAIRRLYVCALCVVFGQS